jgi:signal transduction histidine kinase
LSETSGTVGARTTGGMPVIMEKILSQALGRDLSTLAVEEKRLLLSRLLAHLAHEIRNPLTSLDIHVQLLTEDLAGLAPEARGLVMDRLQIIRGELHRLENVVKHFVGLAGPSSLEVASVDPGVIARNVVELMAPEARGRGIELTVHIAGELTRVRADGVRLNQAMLNLVINALQAVDRNGRVEIRIDPDPAGGHLRISVSDTGPGIPEDKRSAIFEPYYTTKTRGGGLGLWIVQQIVLAHHGRISVGTSTLGGAMISLAIPLSLPDKRHG